MVQRIPVGLVGPSSHTNPAHQTARTVNLYPELGDADAKSIAALFSCPGLILFADMSSLVTGATQIRGLRRMGTRLFVVVGNSIVEVRGDADFHVWATLSTDEGPVGLSDNNGKLVVGDGVSFYVLDFDAGTLSAVTDGVDPIQGWFSAYLDGRTLYLEKGTDRFAWSMLNDATTVDGLSFATAEGNPDPAVAMFVTNREITFLGTDSLEFWATTGDADNPFERVSGGYRDLGCAARWAARPFADAVIFVGQDNSGHAQVYLQGPAGGSPDPISNHGVERDINVALRDYDTDELRAYEYTEPGHKFYVLNLPTGKTWSFDLSTRMWHERGERDPATGLFTSVRQEQHAFWEGEHYVGGASSAKLYKQSRRYNDLAGDPLVRFRETPHIHAQGRMITYHNLIIDMQVGVGLDGTGDGTDPQLMLQYSSDGGRKWSNEITRSIGKIGATLTEVRFGPLGRAIDRVFRISVSDNVPVTFVAAYADVTIGQ